MNDFTKEELIMMCDGIVHIKKTCEVSNSTRIKLDDIDEKLCFMINQYCEHEHLKDVGKYYKVCRMCGDEINE